MIMYKKSNLKRTWADLCGLTVSSNDCFIQAIDFPLVLVINKQSGNLINEKQKKWSLINKVIIIIFTSGIVNVT